MTQSNLDRYKARRALQAKLSDRPRLTLVTDVDAAVPNAQMAEETGRLRTILELDAPSATFHADDQAAAARIAQLGADFDREQLERMLADARRQSLNAIANPFGLGALVSAYDKVGGNVDTVHNARQGVYATEAERQRYDERGAYDKNAYHQHENYRKTNEKYSDALKAGESVTDAYTNQPILPADKNHSQNRLSLDHVVAAKTVHDDAGRVLAELDGPALANIDPNLAPTAHTINSAMKASNADEVGERLNRTADARRERIPELESREPTLSTKERKELNKLKKQEAIDIERVKEKEKAAKAEIDKRINRAYYRSDKFIRSAVSAGAAEGVKMGAQQVFGRVLVEFFAGMIDEIGHWRKHGRSEQSALVELKTRMLRVAQRCQASLKDGLATFGLGFASGFFSSLVTTLINAFVTTGKRMVRVVREGLFSLLNAVRMLVVRPDGMTIHEAMHAASKVLVAGGIVVGGIAIEQWLEQQLALLPFLGAISAPVAAAIVGALVALATGFAVYLLDKQDLFNVNADLRLRAVTNALQSSVAERDAQIAALLQNLGRDLPTST